MKSVYCNENTILKIILYLKFKEKKNMRCITKGPEVRLQNDESEIFDIFTPLTSGGLFFVISNKRFVSFSISLSNTINIRHLFDEILMGRDSSPSA